MNIFECEYCEPVDWEGDGYGQRDLLIGKPTILDGLYVNYGEMIKVDYRIGYFLIAYRKPINYCPICGRYIADEKRRD